MYDTILVPCPKCGLKTDAQTKSGICCLEVYELEDAPFCALRDVNRHAPFTCEKCGTEFEVEFEIVVTKRKVVEVEKDT